MDILSMIVLVIVCAAIFKACFEFIGDWLEALSPWMEYRYAVFFAYADQYGKNHGYGRSEIVSSGKVDSSDEYKDIETVISDSKDKDQVVVTSIQLIKKRNKLIPVLAGCVWVVIKSIAEGVKLSFTRTADDALNEYLQENGGSGDDD